MATNPDNLIALDRDALYYPYIHIPSVNWLKATLLCFPHVRRMVPNYLPLNDPEEIEQFRKVNGPREDPIKCRRLKSEIERERRKEKSSDFFSDL